MMPGVELIYDADCPNVNDARANLLRAFAEAGLQPQWQEWDRGDPESPSQVRGFGSPTILVDGKDVAKAQPSGGDCCRLYPDEHGRLQGVPPVEMIAAAFRESIARSDSGNHRRRSGWRRALAVLPAIGVALLPQFT
jgi:hypothetical protein